MGYVGATPAAKALTSADITDGIIIDADVKSDAAIAMSKTALVGGTGLTLSTNTLNVDASQGGITTVGALDAGSITSGFTSIDVGSGGLTTTGAIAGGTIDATTDFTIGSTVITDDVITFTPTSGDTVTMTADTNGAFSLVTVDTAAAAANVIITADGTVDVNSAGLLTLDSGAAINIEPASGSAILLDGTISIDAGVVTGATSITSTAFVGDITGDVTGTADTATVATTVTITDNESTNESNAIIFTAGGDVDGGNIGLESDGDLTYNPSTGTLTSTTFVGALTGNASGTAATVTGGTQAAITSAANLVTVGTIGTGVWQGTAIASGYIANDAIDSQHYAAGSVDNEHLADDAVDTDEIAAAAVDFANIQNVAANSILGRNANSSGVLSEVALTTTQILIGDGTGFTAAVLSGDASMTNAGAVTVASAAADFAVVNDLSLTSDSAVFNMGAGNDFTITHDGTTGATLAGNPITITAGGASSWTTSAGALTLTSAAAATWSTAAGALTLDGTGGVNINEGGSTIIGISDARVIATTNTASVDLDASGAIQINSSGGALSIGNDNIDQTVNIATAGTRTLNIGINDATDLTTINMLAPMTIDSALTDETVSGITAQFETGEDMNRGDVAYFKAGDSKMWKADSDTAGEMPVVAMAAENIDESAEATGLFLLYGFLEDNGTFPTYTVGGTLYAPETEGPPTQTVPSSTGDLVQVLGWAVTTQSVFFNPSNDVIEHA